MRPQLHRRRSGSMSGINADPIAEVPYAPPYILGTRVATSPGPGAIRVSTTPGSVLAVQG
jgi:hypothetical protein